MLRVLAQVKDHLFVLHTQAKHNKTVDMGRILCYEAHNWGMHAT